MKMATLRCEQCGELFERRAAAERWRVKKGQAGPFCSRPCQVAWRATGHETVTLTCEECGKVFERRRVNEDTRRRRNQGGPYCSSSCARQSERKDPVASFMEKWEYRNGCWQWTAAIAPCGHGRFSINRKTVLPHRVAFEWYHEREIKPDHELHHTCYNPACVNPLHLREVTRKEHSQLHPRPQDGDSDFVAATVPKNRNDRERRVQHE